MLGLMYTVGMMFAHAAHEGGKKWEAQDRKQKAKANDQFWYRNHLGYDVLVENDHMFEIRRKKNGDRVVYDLEARKEMLNLSTKYDTMKNNDFRSVAFMEGKDASFHVLTGAEKERYAGAKTNNIYEYLKTGGYIKQIPCSVKLDRFVTKSLTLYLSMDTGLFVGIKDGKSEDWMIRAMEKANEKQKARLEEIEEMRRKGVTSIHTFPIDDWYAQVKYMNAWNHTKPYNIDLFEEG